MYEVGAKTDVVFSTDTYDPDSLKVREGLRWSTCVYIRCSKNNEAFLGNETYITFNESTMQHAKIPNVSSSRD